MVSRLLSSLLIVKGWTVCPTTVFQNKECASDTSWAASIDYVTELKVYRQNATTAYSQQNLTILNIENMSPPYNYNISTSLFLLLWDKIFTKEEGQTPEDSMMQTGLLYALTWYLRLYQDRYQNDQESPMAFLQNFISVPLQFSGTALQIANATLEGENITNIFPIPQDLKVTASGARVITRFKGKTWTFVTFISIGSVLVLYPGIILGWILLKKESLLFNPSSFPTIDFASLSRYPTDQERSTMANLIQEMNANPSTSKIARVVGRKHIRVDSEPDSQLVLEVIP
jgi:hypothetical protein